MDLYICGILDIILVVGLVISLILGYKKGFMRKALSLVGFLVVVVLSFMFCNQLAAFLIEKGIIYPSIHDPILANVNSSEFFAGSSTLNECIQKGLNLPAFFADMLANGIQNKNPGLDLSTAEAVAECISTYLATTAMNVISFAIIFFGTFLIILILKIFSSALRSNKFIRITDGILGMALYAAIYAAIVCALFWVLSLLMNADWFSGAKDWLTVDMKLDCDAFRISKYVYNGNIIKRIFDLFIPTA